MGIWKNKAGKTVRCNSLAKQFCTRPVELIACPAMRVLSRAAHQVLLRIELELRHHAGHDNGKLIVTKEQFVEFGLHHHAVAAALRELNALGVVIITQRGLGGIAGHRQPNTFLLNYLCGAVDNHDKITNSWKRFKTVQEAEAAASMARSTKDAMKVEYGHRNAKPQGHKPALKPGPQTGPENPKSPGPQTGPTVPGPQTGPTIDTLNGGGSRRMHSCPAPAPGPPPPNGRGKGDKSGMSQPRNAPRNGGNGDERRIERTRAVAAQDTVLPLSAKPKLVWTAPGVFGAERDELLKILVVPEPIPRKLNGSRR
jgi:hypothetical protein